jgi:hypothetical protein
VVETLLLVAPRVATFLGSQPLTHASGFFFARDERLFLVTSRHVLIDEPSKHFPDRIEIETHGDEEDLSLSTTVSLPLYESGRALWVQASDSGGDIDVAALPIDRAALGDLVPHAFTPDHLQQQLGEVEVGTPLLIVGFPLGFHDGRHHLPVARQAAVASSSARASRARACSSPTPARTAAAAARRWSCAVRPTSRRRPACRGSCWASTPRAWTWAAATSSRTSRSA